MLGDCHIHMVLDGKDFRKAMGQHRGGVQDDWIHATLRAYADADVHFLRDGGDALGVTPRTAELAGEYGIDYRTPVFPICRKGRYGGFIGRTFTDFEEYKALVEEVIAAGGDFIKVMIAGLMDFDHFGVVTSQPLDRDEIHDIIAYAHDRGMAVMAHVNGARTIQDAVECGVDSVEHGAYMDDECVACVAESDVVYTPTLATIGNLIGNGRFPDEVLKPLLKYQSDNVNKCRRLGGIIAAGSDAGAYAVPHVQGVKDEIALLEKAGIRTDELQEGEDFIRRRFRRFGVRN